VSSKWCSLVPKSILLIGAGGHCRSIIDIIENTNFFQVQGVIDHQDSKSTEVSNYPVVGKGDDLASFSSKIKYAFPTVGFLQCQSKRAKLFFKIQEADFSIPNIISQRSYISPHAKMKNGNAVMHDVVININCKIGFNNIMQTKSILEHDVVVGNHNYISTSAVINGGVNLGNYNLIGSNVTINQGCNIGDNITIGSGAVVVNEIAEPGTYTGIPARKIK
jgi:sugar O-acyltransferase (sialic acid O-acetyltransferase NeuD family)